MGNLIPSNHPCSDLIRSPPKELGKASPKITSTKKPPTQKIDHRLISN